MFRFFQELLRNTQVIRVNTDRRSTIYLTQADLDAEQQYNAAPHGQLGSGNPRLAEFKSREFSQGTHFDTPNLTDDEKGVLYRIGPNGVTTGQELIDMYTSSHKDLKEGLAMGMAWVADDLAKIESTMSRFPEIMDSLVEKGAVLEPNILEETRTLRTY